MLAEMTPDQFDELVEMDEIEPFGDGKLAWVIALVGAQICNRLVETSFHANELRDVKAVQPHQFIPWYKKPERPKKKEDGYMNPNKMAAIFGMFARK